MIFISGGQGNPDNYDSKFTTELQTMLEELSDKDDDDNIIVDRKTEWFCKG